MGAGVCVHVAVGVAGSRAIHGELPGRSAEIGRTQAESAESEPASRAHAASAATAAPAVALQLVARARSEAHAAARAKACSRHHPGHA